MSQGIAKAIRSSLDRANPCRIAAIALICLIASIAGLESNLRIAWAQASRTGAAESETVRHLVLTVNKSQVVRIDKPFATAIVGSSEIADVLPMTERTVYVQGKKVGATNVSVFDQSMRLVTVLDLEVTVDTVELQSKIRSSTGSKTIRVSNNNGQVVLSGVAGDAVAADRAVSLAKSLVPTGVVNAMTVAPSQQVLLQVRFLEASRDAGRALGVNWRAINGGAGAVVGSGAVSAATGNPLPSLAAAGSLIGQNVGSPAGVVLAKLVNGGTSVDMLITALETKGLVRRLAEPNLVALSGDTARFLAGAATPTRRSLPLRAERSRQASSSKTLASALPFIPLFFATG